MKRTFRYVTAALCLSLAACSSVFDSGSDKLRKDFRHVPESQRMAVYWYWMSDNISVEGVEHDLEAMKKAGIGRAFIGNIWQDNIPAGPHKVLSEEWWKVTHAALKKATELDIEIGIFNCPGWSQSGGPWVTPQESMRYLAGAKLKVQGNGSEQAITLPALPADSRDERVLAYPDMSDRFVSQTVDVHKTAGVDEQKDVTFDEPVDVRSITFEADGYLLANVVIQALENDEFVTLKTVHLDRTNGALNVGFVPQAPIVVALPDTKTKDIRMIFTGGPRDFDVRATVSTEPRMERYAEKSLAKMFQSPLPMWGEYMWPTQAEPDEEGLLVQPCEVIDLTDKLAADGTLTWTVPDGAWTILRTGLAPTLTTNAPASPEATGLEVDKMSRQHVATHFDAFLGEILRRIPAADRKSFKIVVEDSYETGGQNWTDDMLDVFRARYHYDPVPYLPALYGQVIGSQDQSERFLWDLRRLVADRVAYDYVGGLREVSNRNGLITWLECYGHWGFPGEFLMYGGQSDEVAGEFWSEGSLGDIENRAASSCAHIYGKQKVWAESCTSGGPAFTRYPAVMKQRTDRFFCEGINATLLHLYIQQPDDTTFPGISAGFGNEFNRKNVWFSQMDLFTDYLRRCNMMLQQGRYVADVAYYIGEDAPKMTGVCTPALPRGYSFDYINAEVLKSARVKDGQLVLKGGMEYRVLVLPNQTTMRPEVLSCIARLVEQGLTILGPKPTASPSMEGYPDCDKQVRELADLLYAGPTYGKGRVYPAGTELKAVLDELDVRPDCYTAEDKPITFIHRTLKDSEVYFVSNQSGKPTKFDANFRVSGMMPELWNPVTGESRLLPEFAEADGITTLPMQLAAFESLFIVFRKADAKQLAALSDTENFPEPELIDNIDAPWTLTFQEGMRGPAEPVKMDTLRSLTTSEDPAVKFFSGQVDYTNTFSLDAKPEGRLYLDLGMVMVMARVYVNDQYAGGVWTHPYRVNVTDFVKEGENTVRIEVVNNWQNRMVGDLQLPAEERRTYATVNPFNAESRLQDSGLMGPVKLVKE
ncbi:MAG: glycoside hydrolase family 2 [Bacteroidaceae bacterium]|nr:glycoside hydrolase family 2 [Bacteroidaceae bacterium]